MGCLMTYAPSRMQYDSDLHTPGWVFGSVFGSAPACVLALTMTCLRLFRPCYTLTLHTQMCIHHQWIRGNLPSGAKCAVCRKSAGNTKRLEDYRCLWCQKVAHAGCRLLMPEVCSLGRHKISICSPASVHPPRPHANHAYVLDCRKAPCPDSRVVRGNAVAVAADNTQQCQPADCFRQPEKRGGTRVCRRCACSKGCSTPSRFLI